MPFEIPPKLIEILRSASQIAVLSGSGISAESGVPTFRDAQTGLWAQYDPRELATPEAFRRNPKLVWGWYEWRRALVANARPNPGHLALADLESQLTVRGSLFTLITQNVDGLHQRAGSRNVIELHGSIGRTKCFDENIVVEHDAWLDPDGTPPRCPHCGGLLRPDVVWFGEALPRHALDAALTAAQSCDVFFSIGTSSLVQPAASLPLTAIERGAFTIEINPDDTPLTDAVACSLRGKAGEILPALLKALSL